MRANPKFLIKYTSRERPENFFRGLDSIQNNISTENYFILISLDIDDATMNTTEIRDRVNSYKNTVAYWGFSQSKISAINRDIEFAGQFDVLINFSDDQLFTCKGFDCEIEKVANKNFSDTDFFLHFTDSRQNRLATMSIMGDMWFRRTNYIYHPSYYSEYADNEEQEKAKILGKYKYAGNDLIIMDHIHPYQGVPQAMDALYKKNEQFVQQDRENFIKRQSINFGL